ncbi:centrosomal protein of 97 kDa [Dendroctonus ponderosae]|uniref:centrosomal protein of 97 kDa n=1 Tax=Dendroctonus ponderosae TaxID=77166 RepID=UPI0020353022|nr:centrosomal protein of 97 kDa [Dendroctonus ponderosae]
MGKNEETLNLSNTRLKKLNKCTPSESQITELILDDNELQRLDNIDSFLKVEKLSACRNQLLRMYGVCRLHNLHTLNLSNNGILTIEGLKELTGLKWLNLAGNSIKIIEHLNTNINLECLDLSENSVTHISDLAFLKSLKQLFLHKNKINHLSQCDRFLPPSLTTLTLANNNIADLNEISRLAHLGNLSKISIANNPCVNMTGGNIGFDYRPFVINWCLNVNVIDDYVVDAIESLRAEWLYSQGRGRHFRVGDQKELVHYLSTVCPLTGETLETEDDRKLRLILSKAQHHQQQLREQSSNSTPHASPSTRKRMQQGKNSSRLNSLRAASKPKSPDRMAMSCYNTLSGSGDSETNSFMSQSFDAAILRKSKEMSESFSNSIINTEPMMNSSMHVAQMVQVPEDRESLDYRPSTLIEKLGKLQSAQLVHSAPAKLTHSPKSNRLTTSLARSQSGRNCATPSPHRQRKMQDSIRKEPNRRGLTTRTRSPSSEDESEMCASKADERRLQRNTENSNNEKVRQAATCIQKMWRGYYTRNKDKDVQEMFKVLQNQRAYAYIQKLATDMETTKAALESERKIQMLQTEAISALWKKVSCLAGANGETATSASSINMTDLNQDNSDVVKQVAQTCSVLQNQIQQLQHSMQDILNVMAVFSQSAGLSHQLKENGIATQTEIVAVHTPQFQQQHRPSSLPLPVSQRKKDSVDNTNKELQQFADTLVDGVIKTVSESQDTLDVAPLEDDQPSADNT